MAREQPFAVEHSCPVLHLPGVLRDMGSFDVDTLGNFGKFFVCRLLLEAILASFQG